MGFFDGFKKGFNGCNSEREIVEMYHDVYEDSRDYRRKAFDNTDSNHGWYTCPKCGRKFRKSEMDVDHIIPQSRGGTDSRYNLQVLCSHCNRFKGADMSDSRADLRKRERELRKQDREDIKILKNMNKNRRK